MMALGTLLWLCMFGVPLLPLPLATAGLVAGGLFLAGEALFWVGACVAGPPAVRWLARTRSWLRGGPEVGAGAD